MCMVLTTEDCPVKMRKGPALDELTFPLILSIYPRISASRAYRLMFPGNVTFFQEFVFFKNKCTSFIQSVDPSLPTSYFLNNQGPCEQGFGRDGV